jgi:peptidoglycan/LPS O-acetylase OafA/YrhL
MNLGAALCVHWAVTHHAGRIGRVLNAGPVAFVGVISYSIYLWQQLFLNRYSTALACSFPLNILLVAAASMASFYMIERPSLQVRHRLERRLFARASAKERPVATRARLMSISPPHAQPKCSEHGRQESHRIGMALQGGQAQIPESHGSNRQGYSDL